MSKVNTGQASSTLIPKYIGSDFDKVVSVANNIEQVVIVGDNVEDVGTVADNINYVKEVAEDLHGMPVTMYTGENPPVLNPMPEGVMWYCTTDGRTYVWYTDADSGQWVESAPQSAMKDEATNIFLHSVPSNVNSAYRSATLYSTSSPEAEISVAHNALNTPVVQAQFIREEALWVDVSVTGAQGIVTLMGYSSGSSQMKAEIITWKNGAEGTSLGASQWVTLPSQPSVVSLPVTLANIDVLDAGDSYVVKLTSQMNAGSSAVSTILVDGNTSSRFGIIFNTNLIGLNDGIRDGVITSAPTENAVYDALQLKVGKSQLVQSGNLTSTAKWANVPAYSDSELGGLGGPLNAQAKALTARSELLLTDVREALRRSYAEAGYNVVGTFQTGFTYANAYDIGIDEVTGKGYTGPAGYVAAGTDPTSGGFVDKSDVIKIPVTYAGIRAYSGPSAELQCIGRQNIFDRGHGDFVRDDTDTTSPDNDGTVLIDALGRRWKRLYDGAVLVDWFGAVDDGLSSTPTDSYAAIQAAINSVTKAGSQGGAVALDGAYYSSQTIVIDYRPNPSHFIGGKGIGVFALRGKTGMHHDKIIFPETCDSGINSNPTNVVTSVQMHDFAVIRLGFDVSIYAPRTGQRSPNTFDPRYGYGIRDSTNGYTGFVKNIYIEGFYTLLQVYQAYAARYEGIFAVNKTLYGFWGLNCSTVHVSDSTFGGYQAGWCADKGLYYTENVTIEGSLTSVNSNPALLSSWDCIGFQFTDSSWISLNDYCEKLGGPCIDALNSRVDVNSRAMSNGQWWEVNSGTTLSAAAKAALLAKDPNLTNIKWVVSAGQSSSAAFRGGFTRQEKMYLQDGGTPGMFVANNTEVYIPATSVEQAAEMFTNQRAARIVLANVIEQWTPNNQIPATRVAGCLEVRLPYSTNYTGFSGLSVGRNKASAWGSARNKFEYIPTTDDLLYMYRSVYDSAGVETKTTVWAPYGPSGHEFRRPIYAQTQVSNGLPTNLWSVVYAASGAISTSDGRYKTDVRDLNEKEHAVAKKIKVLLKAFRFKEAVDQKGVQNARIHFGVIAQDVEEAFKSEGLAPEEYGLFCFDEWEELPEIVDESGEVIQEYRPAGNRYGVRYEELLSFVLAAI